MITDVLACRACGGALNLLFSLGSQPLADFSKKAPLWAYAPMDVGQCESCQLVQLMHTVDRSLLFGERYWYRSGVSETMRAHLGDLSSSILKHVPSPQTVVDIGSNDGTLLDMFPSAVKIGYEPSDAWKPRKGVHLVNGFFSAQDYAPYPKADVVTSIAMFYSVEDVRSFVSDIRSILAPNGIWVCEMNDLTSLVTTMAWDTICHEHLAYWSWMPFQRLLKEEGLEVYHIERNRSNGGSVRYFVQHRRGERRGSLQALAIEADLQERVETLDATIATNASRIRSTLTGLKKQGNRIYGYGASTRGVTIANVANIDETLLDGISERMSEKWGYLYPGTGIPIVSEEQARKAKPDYYLVFPYSYIKQFVAREDIFIRNGGKFVLPLPSIRVLP